MTDRLFVRIPFFFATGMALLLAGPSTVEAQAVQNGAAPVSAAEAAATITEESVLNRLYFLASDGLRGRDTPSAGLDAAAAYLVSEHRRAGLEPAGENGTFYQHWPFRRIAPDLENASITLAGAGGSVSIVPGENGAMRGGADGRMQGPLVFVGEPIGRPAEAGSLEGRVAVFHIPGQLGPQWRQRANQLNAWAGNAGAAASVVVMDDGIRGDALAQLSRTMAEPAWRMGEQMPAPQIFVTRGAARQALPELNALLGRGGAFEEPIQGGRLEGTLPADVIVDARPANVIAMIRGSDPQLRDEYVVLSAHYDHVGVGQPMNGDSIYNGADDNGSGTTALLETARAIAGMDVAPRRSILFVHVSGEEKGLLGSSWFVDNATVPVEQMVANINADMVGGDAHRDTLVVIGKDYSTLGPLVDRVNDGLPELNLTTSDDLWPEQRFFFRSDQFHFMRKEVPSLFFFTGVHECYHRPCDTVDFVSHDKLARVTRLITHSVLTIANQDERPQWDPAGLQEVRDLVGGGR